MTALVNDPFRQPWIATSLVVPVPHTFSSLPSLDAPDLSKLDQDLAACADSWFARLSRDLQAWRIDPGTADGFLLLALPAATETHLDSLFTRSPAQSYLAQRVAQGLLAWAAAAFVPELADLGCAPLAVPPKSVQTALAACGIAWREPAGLSRSLALITPMPFRGGCQACLLSASCPRKRTVAANP